VTRTFDPFLVFQIVDPAAKMGAGAGNCPGMVVFHKEDEVLATVGSTEWQGSRYLHELGLAWHLEGGKTDERIEKKSRTNGNDPLCSLA
jgi:hypothetical protein